MARISNRLARKFMSWAIIAGVAIISLACIHPAKGMSKKVGRDIGRQFRELEPGDSFKPFKAELLKREWPFDWNTDTMSYHIPIDCSCTDLHIALKFYDVFVDEKDKVLWTERCDGSDGLFEHKPPKWSHADVIREAQDLKPGDSTTRLKDALERTDHEHVQYGEPDYLDFHLTWPAGKVDSSPAGLVHYRIGTDESGTVTSIEHPHQLVPYRISNVRDASTEPHTQDPLQWE